MTKFSGIRHFVIGNLLEIRN